VEIARADRDSEDDAERVREIVLRAEDDLPEVTAPARMRLRNPGEILDVRPRVDQTAPLASNLTSVLLNPTFGTRC